MSVATEIERINGLKARQRTKLIALGIGSASDALEDCTEEIESIANNGAVAKVLDADDTSYTVPAGYHNGSGVVSIVPETKNITANGTYTPTNGKVLTSVTVDVQNAPVLQAKTATPTKATQVISPDDGYDALSEVTVNPIPDAYQDVTPVTAAAGDVLANKTIVNAAGAVVAGTMANNGAVAATIDGLTVTSYTVTAGYHNGSGTVSLTSDIENALAAI